LPPGPGATAEGSAANRACASVETADGHTGLMSASAQGEPSSHEVAEYLERHRLQAFLSDVICFIARRLPPDPFDFLMGHIAELVEEHRCGSKVRHKTSEPLVPNRMGEAPQVAPEQQDTIVRHVGLVLQHPDLTRASALKLFGQFTGDSRQLSKVTFSRLLKHLEASWGLQASDTELMVDVLKRWRFRANAASGTNGLPLWPLSLDDFASCFPNLLRAVRDRYMPIGGMVNRALFIRQAAGQLTDKYDVGPRLGRGAYGEVRLVTLRTTQERRVSKRVLTQQTAVPMEELLEEVNLLRGLDHPHIIRIFEYFISPKHIEMIMEPVFGGTLAKLVQDLYADGDRPEALTEAWVASLLGQLLGALSYAHDVVGVIHKDLKNENVLLVGPSGREARAAILEPPYAMLADFGIAEVFAPDPLLAPATSDGSSGVGDLLHNHPGLRLHGSAVGGTPAYMSPEMFQGSFTEKCDIWSLGCVCFSLLTGQLPYVSSNLLAQANVICNPRRHPPWELLSKQRWALGARAFCQQLLSKDERLRPSAAEAAKDDWLVKEQHALRTEVAAPGLAEKASLQQHHMQSHLMHMARHCITSQLSLTPLQDLNARFRYYDRDGNGRLSLLEMRQVLEDVGITSSNDVDLIVESLDCNRNGSIEYSEFIAGCIDLASADMRGHIRAVFDVFDLDGSGDISIDELRQVLTQGANPDAPTGAASPGLFRAQNVLPDGKTVEEVMRELDANGTGKVEFEEFQRYLLAEHAKMGRKSIREYVSGAL